MPDTLADLLLKAKEGEVTPNVLRAEVTPEYEKLREAETASRESDKGWMGTADLLEGATANEKMANYATRLRALGEANDWLAQENLMRQQFASVTQSMSAQMAQMAPPPLQPQGETKTFATEQHTETIRNTRGGVTYRAMMESPIAQQLANLTPSQRHETIRANTPLGIVDGETYHDVVIRATYGYSATTAQGGIAPTDRIGMPYELLTDELRYIQTDAAPGSFIRFFESRTPDAANLTAGPVRGRARGSTLHEDTESGNVIARTKNSLGAMIKMAYEDLRDNAMIGPRNDRQLDINVRNLMVEQILQGTGSGNSWNGIITQDLATAPPTGKRVLAANIGAFAAGAAAATNQLTANNVPVLTSGLREPVTFIKTLTAYLAQRGTPPTVLMVNARDWGVITQSIAGGFRYMNDDFAAAPWGRVGPVPMVLSRHLGDNQALLTNTSMAWGVELGENVVTAVSDDYAFGDHQVTIKRLVDGAVWHAMPYGSILITGTNNWQPQLP